MLVGGAAVCFCSLRRGVSEVFIAGEKRRESKAGSGGKGWRETVARAGSDGWVVRRRVGLMPATRLRRVGLRRLRRLLRH